MVQRKRSLKRRSLRKKGLRKKSLRKRSLKKKSRKRSQSGGGLFNWYSEVSRTDCIVLAENLIKKNKYKKPEPFIHDYSAEIAKQSGVTVLGVIKSGFFTLLSADVAAEVAAGVAITAVGSATNSFTAAYGTGGVVKGVTFLAVLVALVHSTFKGRSKQAKMILQAACDAWNAEYDNQITLADIKNIIEEDELAHQVMKDVKKAKKSDIKKAEAQDKIHFGK